MTNIPCGISSTDADCSQYFFLRILFFQGLDLVVGHLNKDTNVWIGISNSNCCSAEDPTAAVGSSFPGHCFQSGSVGSKSQWTGEIVFDRPREMQRCLDQCQSLIWTGSETLQISSNKEWDGGKGTFKNEQACISSLASWHFLALPATLLGGWQWGGGRATWVLLPWKSFRLWQKRSTEMTDVWFSLLQEDL